MESKLKQLGLSLLEFSLILIIASSIVRLASSLYLPSLIDMGESLNMSEKTLAMTLTLFFISYAVGTVFVGPLVDYYGRKEMIVAGSVVFIIGSTFCGVAESHTALFTGRVLQALGASAIPVSSRAMIREYCSDIDVIKVLGWLAGIGGIIPIVAPALGGIITETLSWRYNFYLLIVFSFLALIYAYIKLPKSIDKSLDISLSNIFKNYINILKSPHFFIVITPLAFAFLLQGVFLVSTPFIFMKSYSLSAFEYGLTNIITALALLFGQALAIRLIKRYSIYFAYIFGGVLTLIGGVIVAVFINLDILSMPLFLSAMFISVSGFGTTLPVGIKSIMTAFDKNMGMVSALHGFITLSFMAVGSYIFTLFRDILDMEYITILTMCIISVGLLMSTLSIYTKRYLR